MLEYMSDRKPKRISEKMSDRTLGILPENISICLEMSWWE